MSKLKLISTLLIIFIFLQLHGEYGNWQTMPALTSINKITLESDNLYLATNGGLYIQDQDNITKYAPEDGLLNYNLASVVKDFRNHFWCVGYKGEISIFNPSDEKFTPIYDLKDKDLNFITIKSTDDAIYVLYDKLLLKYVYNNDFDKYQVKESNSMLSNNKDLMIENDKVYLLEDQLYSISIDANNYSDIGLWDIEATNSIIETNIITNIIISDDILYGYNTTSVFIFENNNFRKILNIPSGEIVKITNLNEQLYLLYNKKTIAKLETENSSFSLTTITTLNSNAENFLLNNKNIYYTLENKLFIKNFDTDLEQNIFFNSLDLANNKKALFFNNKILVLAEKDISYYNITTNTWGKKNVFDGEYKGSLTNFIENQNKLFIGTWGKGLHEVDIDEKSDTLAFTYSKNYQISSALNTSSYYINAGLTKAFNTIYFSAFYGNNTNYDRQVVYSIKDNILDSLITETSNFSKGYELFYTDNNWLCVGSSEQGLSNAHGLLLYNKLDHTSKQFKDIGAVISLTQDKNDTLWVGTNTGAKKIYTKNTVLSSLSDSDIEPFKGTLGDIIYKIKESPNGDLWFATNLGISVKKVNGSIIHYISNNYQGTYPADIRGIIVRVPMLDTAISDIIFNDGYAYLISDNGISYFDYDESNDYSLSNNIATIPAPMKSGNNLNPTTFNFTPSEFNRVKIFDIRGRLVVELFSDESSDQYFTFNGKDKNNKYLSSGIYQVIAYNKNDPTNYKTGKIAVIRD